MVNISRGYPLDQKKDALESYVAPAPVLLIKTEHAIQDVFINEYADQAFA